MTMVQRSVWVQLFVFPSVGLVYFTIMLARVTSTPIEEVRWKVPLLIAMGVAVAAIITITILAAIGQAMASVVRDQEPDLEEGDIRDNEIDKEGDYRARHFVSVGALTVIVLAMVGVDHIWIANAMFFTGLAGATFAAAVKLRMYRQGL